MTTLIRYQAYELVNMDDRSMFSIPAPGIPVVTYADYAALEQQTRVFVHQLIDILAEETHHNAEFRTAWAWLQAHPEEGKL